MNDSVLIGAVIGAAVGLAVVVQRLRSRKLDGRIVPLLREKGALTLPEVATALGMGGFLARGKVAMALSQMQLRKLVEVIPAPAGTPQLDKVNHIKYRLLQG